MKKLLMLTVALFSLLIVAPVSAQEVTDEIESARNVAEERASQRQEKKEQRVADIKKEVEARKIEVKKEVCEKREERLKQLLPKLNNGGERVKGSIDKVYERVQGFYESGKLTVSNYQTLVEAIELAKANAESALATVDTYSFEVDCESETVGTQLDSYRTAVKEACEALKTYRDKVVDLVSALRAQAATRTNETSNSTTEENSNE